MASRRQRDRFSQARSRLPPCLRPLGGPARFLINGEGLLSHLDFISRLPLPPPPLPLPRRRDLPLLFLLSLMFASDDHFSIPSRGPVLCFY